MTDFERKANFSRKSFDEFVLPAMKFWGYTSIVSTEQHESELKRLMDYAGIDALAQKAGSVIAFSSRLIQKISGGSDYQNFSIRDKRNNNHTTELEKLRGAIKQNSLRPMISIQGFVEPDEQAATIAFCRTRDLIHFVADRHETRTKSTRDGTRFLILPWRDLIQANCAVRILQVANSRCRDITAVFAKKITAAH